MDRPVPVRFTEYMMSANTAVARNGSFEKAAWNRTHPVSADDTLIVVQTEWKGWRTATARLTDLEKVHWFQPSGAPRPLIHAYVRCTNLQSGDLSHDCQSASGPHELLVCVLKCHTSPSVFEELSRLASKAGGPVMSAPSGGRC